MSYGNLSDLKRNTSIRDMTAVGSIGNISTIAEDGGSGVAGSAASSPTPLSCSPLTATSAAGTPVRMIVSSHSDNSMSKKEEEEIIIVTSVKDISLTPPKKSTSTPISQNLARVSATAPLNSPSPVPFSEPEAPKNPSPVLGKSPRPSMTRQMPMVDSSPRRRDSNGSSSHAEPPSARSNGYDESVPRSLKDREAVIAALEAPDPLLDGEPTGIGALDHAMHYLKRHEHQSHHEEYLHQHHALQPRSARSGSRSSRPQSSEHREGHKHNSNLPPLNAHHNLVVAGSTPPAAVFVPRRSQDTYPDDQAWESSSKLAPTEGVGLDDLLTASGASTGEGKKYQRRLSISR